MLRTVPVTIRAIVRSRSSGLFINRALSTSIPRRSDPLPSLLEGVASPLEVATVLRSGKGFKIRSLQDPTPHTIHGNVILLEGEYFLWRPKLQSLQSGMLDISPEAWGILDVISPKPEIMVLGTGDKIVFVQRVREALAKMGIQVDVQDTKNAASMFNLLQAEGRSVAAALLTQESINNIE